MRGNSAEAVTSLKALEDFRWESSWTRTKFLSEFDNRVENLVKTGVSVSEDYLGIKLLQSSKLDQLGGTLTHIR